MLLDTGGLRGYLKYPLREQAWLWHKVTHEFAEGTSISCIQRFPALPAPCRRVRRGAVPERSAARSAGHALHRGGNRPGRHGGSDQLSAGTDRIELYKINNCIARSLVLPAARAAWLSPWSRKTCRWARSNCRRWRAPRVARERTRDVAGAASRAGDPGRSAPRF
ncbi:MAG: hypothetical protein WDM96_02950 [Lacunisphaera sp.]